MKQEDLKKLLRKFAGDRTKLIDALLVELQKEVGNVQKALLTRFVEDWVNKLDVDKDTGLIKNTLRNKRLLDNVDTIFVDYVKTDGVVIAKTMVDGINQILDFNGDYYKGLDQTAMVVPIKAEAKALIESWLGLKGNGYLTGNGYLAKTISDPKILGDLKNVALRSVVGQQGYRSTLEEVKNFISGNKEQAGLLEKYARNFVYDTYSQVDRVTAAVFADKLQLDYAMYEGGLIKTSRKFCRERNGKVFTRAEIADMLPKEGIPPNYNPFNDMGGYGCRHHWNWMGYTLAVFFRPDLKKD